MFERKASKLQIIADLVQVSVTKSIKPKSHPIMTVVLSQYQSSWSTICRCRRLNMAALAGLVFIVCLASVQAYPHAKISMFPTQSSKLDNKLTTGDDSEAERSFQQFIHSKPESSESIVIGELKPNSSELELVLMKNKIASTILGLQQMDKARNEKLKSPVSSANDGATDCFIEVTRVERIPGKCQKVNDGLPICQSEGYMAINSECSGGS